MSQENNIDGEFEALLNADDMADIEAAVAIANPDLKIPAVAPTNAAASQETAAAAQETKQAVVAPKPSIGKKRQLLVPQGGSNKRMSLQVKASTAADAKESSPTPAAVKDKPPTEDTQASTAPLPTMAKPTAPSMASTDAEQATETKVAGDMEVDAAEAMGAADTDMQDAGAVEEPEVQSPLKKAATPEPQKPAPATSAPSATAMAAGKRKGLTVAKAGTESSDPPPSTIAKPKVTASSSAPRATDASNAAKLPKAQTAFFFFCADKRPGLKESTPGLSMGEYAKKLGEMWKELSEEDKKTYNDKAIADKERVATELANMGADVVEAIKKASADARAAKKEKKAGPTKDEAKAAAKAASDEQKALAKAERAAQKKAAKAAKTEALKHEQAAWKVYHSTQYATFKADHPGVEAAELNKLMLTAWDALEQSDKDTYQQKADEVAEAAAAAKAARNPGKSSKAARKVKKPSNSSAADDAEEDSQHEASGAAGGGSRSRRAAEEDADDDESDREEVDWESNPADAILSSGAGSYLVARKGLMLTEYGKVDMRKAKERLLHSASASSASALPVTTKQVEEYDKACSRFWGAVRSRMHKGCLDLDELEEGSPLEMCYLLGKLQEPGQLLYPQAKYPKGDLDVMRRLPVMRLSMAVQRLQDLERRRTNAAHKEAAQYKEGLTTLLAAVQDKGDKALQDDSAVAAATALLDTN